MMQEFYDQFHPNVKDVKPMQNGKVGENLGTDPKTGNRFV
jgi:DNA topoisomerase-1